MVKENEALNFIYIYKIIIYVGGKVGGSIHLTKS